MSDKTAARTLTEILETLDDHEQGTRCIIKPSTSLAHQLCITCSLSSILKLFSLLAPLLLLKVLKFHSAKQPNFQHDFHSFHPLISGALKITFFWLISSLRWYWRNCWYCRYQVIHIQL